MNIEHSSGSDMDPAGREWLHALRNAVGAVSTSLAVASKALKQHDSDRALEFMGLAMNASERCRKLLETQRDPQVPDAGQALTEDPEKH